MEEKTKKAEILFRSIKSGIKTIRYAGLIIKDAIIDASNKIIENHGNEFFEVLPIEMKAKVLASIFPDKEKYYNMPENAVQLNDVVYDINGQPINSFNLIRKFQSKFQIPTGKICPGNTKLANIEDKSESKVKRSKPKNSKIADENNVKDELMKIVGEFDKKHAGRNKVRNEDIKKKAKIGCPSAKK